MIVVVDYGMGNIGSILNMLGRIGAPAKSSNRAEDVLAADKLILPGVGAFGRGTEALSRLGLIEPLNSRVLGDRVPILGLCLGMQLFAAGSEEGDGVGLGWIDAEVVRFRSTTPGFKIPHMGWNTLDVARPHQLLPDRAADSRYYFAHSYYLTCREPTDVVASTTYGYAFPSVVARGNIAGVQFHPEKSHRFGLQLLTLFAGAPAA